MGWPCPSPCSGSPVPGAVSLSPGLCHLNPGLCHLNPGMSPVPWAVTCPSGEFQVCSAAAQAGAFPPPCCPQDPELTIQPWISFWAQQSPSVGSCVPCRRNLSLQEPPGLLLKGSGWFKSPPEICKFQPELLLSVQGLILSFPRKTSPLPVLPSLLSSQHLLSHPQQSQGQLPFLLLQSPQSPAPEIPDH